MKFCDLFKYEIHMDYVWHIYSMYQGKDVCSKLTNRFTDSKISQPLKHVTLVTKIIHATFNL